MRTFAELEERINSLSRRAAHPGADAALIAQLDALLSEGYAHALDGDARGRRLDEQITQLIDLNQPGAATEVRRLALERRSLERAIADLRSRLAVVRDQFARLGGGRKASD
jgi:hypothetical protein